MVLVVCSLWCKPPLNQAYTGVTTYLNAYSWCKERLWFIPQVIIDQAFLNENSETHVGKTQRLSKRINVGCFVMITLVGILPLERNSGFLFSLNLGW
jgi:hypothetical protein